MRPGEPPLETATTVEGAGYKQELKREFSFWSAFLLGFAFISPVIGLYGIFAFAFLAGGPAFWWGFPVVLAGQMLVALVFAELASVYPLAGGVYQWARQLLGPQYGWIAGWSYNWTLLITMAAVAYGGAYFLAVLIGFDHPTNLMQTILAIGILTFTTVINTAGRKYLETMVRFSIGCELIGSVAVGTVLLLFFRQNSLSVIFQFGDHGASTYFLGPFIAATAFVGWAFVGFESAGSIAEEVQDPAREVPWAIVSSLFVVACVIAYAGLALVLAIPNIAAVMSGANADPITETLHSAFGPAISIPLFAVIVIGFVAGLSALQTAVSRSLFSMARDRLLPMHRVLSAVSTGDQLPVNAILASGLICALLFFFNGSNVYLTLVSFATGGFYLSFGFPILAALIVRTRGQYVRGPFSLGRFGYLINVLALIWLVFEAVNIAWPRTPELPWYQNYGVVLMTAILGAFGFCTYLWTRREIGAPVAQEM